MKYVLQLGPGDRCFCAWDGQEFRAESRHGSTMALARTMVASGVPDLPWVAVDYLDGMELLYGPSLHRLAALTVEENASAGPRFTRWKPVPESLHATP